MRTVGSLGKKSIFKHNKIIRLLDSNGKMTMKELSNSMNIPVKAMTYHMNTLRDKLNISDNILYLNNPYYSLKEVGLQ